MVANLCVFCKIGKCFVKKRFIVELFSTTGFMTSVGGVMGGGGKNGCEAAVHRGCLAVYMGD